MSYLDHNLEAEASVIGGAVLGGVVPDLEVDDFYDGRHRTIWEGIQSVYACLAAKESAQTQQFVEVRQVGSV